MRNINSFLFLTLNGFYKDVNATTAWHQHGGEAAKFSEASSSSGNELLFGRVTYEMMASFWPTPMAAQLFPVVAKNMNEAKKYVVTDSLKGATWASTSIIQGDVVSKIRTLKASPGPDITILGSGSLVTLLTDAGLIDSYTFMMDPVVIGVGTPVFSKLKEQIQLKLTSTRVLSLDGRVVLTYSRI